MVSAPDTKSTSVQAIPASRMASRAAATPYSTKLRPHLPHGCMETPSTAISRSLMLPLLAPAAPGRGARVCCSGYAPRDARSCDRPPLPHDVLVLVVLEERADLELDGG